MKLRSLAGIVVLVVGTAFITLYATHSTRTTAAETGSAKGPIYAQLSSAVSQKPKDGKALIVKMESNDALQGLIHSDKQNTGQITVPTPGVYFVVAAIQVGKDSPSPSAEDYVDVWIKQNGKDVDNSGCRQVIKDPKFTTVLVCQGIAECKANDVFNVAISASSPGKGLGIVAIKPKDEPVIPSIIFSMYKIN